MVRSHCQRDASAGASMFETKSQLLIDSDKPTRESEVVQGCDSFLSAGSIAYAFSNS